MPSLFSFPPCIPLPGMPLLATPVPAGFPSPATDYVETRLSLDEHLIEHQEATFFVRVQGNSMTGFGIHDGDLLVVDRSKEAVDRSVVIAVVDGQFMVKQACRLPEGMLLRSNGPGHGDMLVSGDQELSVWGVVRWAIHKVV
jgi:DNA polymerase V